MEQKEELKQIEEIVRTESTIYVSTRLEQEEIEERFKLEEDLDYKRHIEEYKREFDDYYYICVSCKRRRNQFKRLCLNCDQEICLDCYDYHKEKNRCNILMDYYCY